MRCWGTSPKAFSWSMKALTTELCIGIMKTAMKILLNELNFHWLIKMIMIRKIMKSATKILINALNFHWLIDASTFERAQHSLNLSQIFKG